MLPGIDVSQWNATYDPAGQAFVFIRACYGTGKDPKYDQHLATAKAARLVTGAYCFGRDMDPIYQADRLLEIGKDADLLVLDWETDEGHGKMTSAQARAFIAHVRKANRTVGLYASESGYPADGFGADFRWVANYSRRPSIPWSFWQYAGTGIDRNWYAGTMAELLALAGRVVQVPLPSEDEPMTTNLFPMTTHRVADLKAGTELLKSPGGDHYTTLPADITLGLIEAVATHYKVADGDYGVWVKRGDAVIRTADKNVGA